jgi:type IV pilus assembly protein PilN
VQKFETQRAQLQQRVALIEDLRKGQTGPVHMLDQISRALPDRLWLTQMKDDVKDGSTAIEGMTTSMTALSDFVTDLETSGYFKRPVEIVSSTLETQQGNDLVKFIVKATFAAPGSAAAAPAAAVATPAKPATPTPGAKPR